MKNIAIILASGMGERSGLDIPKQFIRIGGKTVLEHTLEMFESHKLIDSIIIVTSESYITKVKKYAKSYSKVTDVVQGGQTRQESSYKGLLAINEFECKVLIHDAVRPFVNSEIIDNCIKALENYDAVDVAVKSADTIIKINNQSLIEEIPNRNYLRRGQTPQAFDYKVIKKAHELALSDPNLQVTDDCGLVLRYNLSEVFVVEGNDYNMKITYPIDIEIADKLFQLKMESAKDNDLNKLKDKVIVIFGGTQGIGEAISGLAKSYGANVHACSRKTGIDITNIESVQKYLQFIKNKTGQIDFIINTAGVLNLSKLHEKSNNDILQEINVNYLGAVNVAKTSYQYLKESKGCLLLFASSSYTRGRANYAIYSSTKSAIVNLTQALAEEWIEDGIKINVITPQRTATQMRLKNFGEEPADTLLLPETVARESLNVLLSNISGEIINIRNENI